MILNSPDMKPTDKYLKQILDDNYRGGTKQRYITRLPCGCQSIELEQPADLSGVCNMCGKPFHLIWQRQPKFKGVA